jgi:hypothetical protein
VALATRHADGAGSTPAFDVSFVAGSAMGGTEIRDLVAHGGKLYAANGYWKDAPGLSATPGPQVLVLDGPGQPWRIDHEFDERMPRGHRRHIAVSALSEVTFHTDARGAALPAPVSMLLASTWDITARRVIFARDDRTGEWSGTVIALGTPAPGFLPQIRTFGTHRDRRTGVDLAFAGDTTGIFAGVFDPGVLGRIRWSTTPEFATSGLNADAFPGLKGRLRISSFAEADGRLFAAVGQQIWVRQDNAAPEWHRLWTNPSPRYSQTGARGLTAVSEPGKPTFLLAAIEGNGSRIVRVDPATGAETTDLDLNAFLDTAWGTRVSYVIGAYNDMTKLPDGELVIGLEAFIPLASPRPPGHVVLDVNHGLEGGAWFLIRLPGGRYELHQITARFPVIGQNLVAARAFALSPFPSEPAAVYAGGYDANDTPARDTAWIARFVLDRGP